MDATAWTGTGSNTTVAAGKVTANTSNSNYQLGGVQIIKNTFQFKATFLPNTSNAQYGYGVTHSTVPDDSDDIDFGFEWFAGDVSPDKLIRVKEGGVTAQSWDWTTGDYFVIAVTSGTVVYNHYNSSDVLQNTWTSLTVTFDFTAHSYYIAAMQGGFADSSNITSEDNLSSVVSTGVLLPPPIARIDI